MFGKMFFVSVILLQVFTFGLGRSLQWLFVPWIGKVGRHWLRPLQNSPKSPKFPPRHLGDFP